MFRLLGMDEPLRGFTGNAETFRQLIGACRGNVIHFRRASGEVYHARGEDIILHLFPHGHHHRGPPAVHFARRGVGSPARITSIS